MNSELDQPRLVICICTYARTRLVLELISELILQVKFAGYEDRTRILVVDNEAGSVLNAELGRFVDEGVKIDYLPEPVKGIGHARNRAFSDCKPSEWLIFFDDDQRPEPSWLTSYVKVLGTSQEGLWVGPVTPRFIQEVPSWGGSGWPWGAERAHYADGANRTSAGFGNILFSPDVLASSLCRVADDFLVRPGEDTSVSVGLVRSGFKITFLASAAATEVVVTGRMTRSWVLSRANTDGETWGLIRRTHGLAGLLGLTISAAKATLLGVAHLVSAPSTGTRRAELAMRGRYKLALARGMSRSMFSRNSQH